MASAAIPPGVIDRIVEVLDPEQVWLFGSRARETHGPSAQRHSSSVVGGDGTGPVFGADSDGTRRIVEEAIA